MADRQPIALVVDDEPDICELISMTLRQMHVRADVAMSVSEATRRLSEKQYDFCLTDMRLPDGDGLQLVEKIQGLPADQAPPVAVITAHGNMDTAIAALKLGAFDFVSKPVNLERLRALVQLALRLNEDRNLDRPEFPALLHGQSIAIQTLRTQIEKLARSDAPIYIIGEAGSGKELTARSIHEQGPRASKPFIPMHCAAIPKDQLEIELFGTLAEPQETPELTSGPTSGRIKGLLQRANGGTLFLDEIAALPQNVQVKLLRALEEKSFYPPGSNTRIDLDIRILSASHNPLTNEVHNGRLRGDLFYRIHVIELSVPPLRQRAEDIPLLTRNLLRRITEKSKGGTPRVGQDAINALQAYEFPGNLRELENILERALTLCESSTLRADDLQLPVESPPPPASHSEEASYRTTDIGEKTAATAIADAAPEIYTENRSDSLHSNPNASSNPSSPYPEPFSAAKSETLDDFLQSIEREAIVSALGQTRWNRTAAAEKLGISFRSLRYRLKKLGLESE